MINFNLNQIQIRSMKYLLDENNRIIQNSFTRHH